MVGFSRSRKMIIKLLTGMFAVILICFGLNAGGIRIRAQNVSNSKGTSIDDFVERLYTVALNRQSESDGKKFWSNEVKSGKRTGADCARYFLLEAPEFLNRKLSTEDFVETLYMTFFGRASENKGKQYWVGELRKGKKDRKTVINGFIDSTEWCNICASYGVKSGAPNAKAEYASQNAIEFATRLYTCCLGRNPENAGLNYWSLALTNLEKTGADAAQQFFESQEYQNLQTDNREYVIHLYRTFMGREPDSDGLRYWLDILMKNPNRSEILKAFSESKEFSNICAKYGIERGSAMLREDDGISEIKRVLSEIDLKSMINLRLYNNYIYEDSLEKGIVYKIDIDGDGMNDYISSYDSSMLTIVALSGKHEESIYQYQMNMCHFSPYIRNSDSCLFIGGSMPGRGFIELFQGYDVSTIAKPHYGGFDWSRHYYEDEYSNSEVYASIDYGERVLLTDRDGQKYLVDQMNLTRMESVDESLDDYTLHLEKRLFPTLVYELSMKTGYKVMSDFRNAPYPNVQFSISNQEKYKVSLSLSMSGNDLKVKCYREN
ncbi:MAG: DUF4214 domain-containing protein [Clostridiales bacterium]|nr:DUF4214 domain-containing protein [Clostridiales bacterium]